MTQIFIKIFQPPQPDDRIRIVVACEDVGDVGNTHHRLQILQHSLGQGNPRFTDIVLRVVDAPDDPTAFLMPVLDDGRPAGTIVGVHLVPDDLVVHDSVSAEFGEDRAALDDGIANQEQLLINSIHIPSEVESQTAVYFFKVISRIQLDEGVVVEIKILDLPWVTQIVVQKLSVEVNVFDLVDPHPSRKQRSWGETDVFSQLLRPFIDDHMGTGENLLRTHDGPTPHPK